MSLEQWEIIEHKKECLKVSASLNYTQNLELALLIELAYNTGKTEILNRGKV
jgi:hypothetical protein